MEDEDAQNLPRSSIESYAIAECNSSEGVHIQRIEEFHLQRLDFSSWNYFPPAFHNQLAYYSSFSDPHWEQYYWPLATGPTVLSPWHISGASVQVALTPGVSNSDENPGDVFGRGFGITDDRIWALTNGPRPGRRITGPSQDDSFRGTNLPFNQGNDENDVPRRLCNPNLFYTTSNSQSPCLSPQQLEYIPSTHPNSPFERHPHQDVEAPDFSRPQRIPEMETAQGSRIRLIGSKEWPCDRDGCNKSYGRPQDVRRHVREKHEVLPKCFICGIKWTRAEKVRRHLIKDHRNHFTKKERQQIRQLQGLNNTVNFFKKRETTRL